MDAWMRLFERHCAADFEEQMMLEVRPALRCLSPFRCQAPRCHELASSPPHPHPLFLPLPAFPPYFFLSLSRLPARSLSLFSPKAMEVVYLFRLARPCPSYWRLRRNHVGGVAKATVWSKFALPTPIRALPSGLLGLLTGQPFLLRFRRSLRVRCFRVRCRCGPGTARPPPLRSST